jgi:hypothetical protein
MLGNGFLPMFAQGGVALPAWAGATWAVSGGNAYNVPTLGSELLIDGGLENWTSATNLTSWDEFIAGTSTINRESTTVYGGTYSCRLNISASGDLAQIARLSATVAGGWYRSSVFVQSDLPTQFVVGLAGVSEIFLSSETTWAERASTHRATGANYYLLGRTSGISNGRTIYLDDASLKAISLPTLFATITGASSNQTAAAKIATLTTGTQSGVVALLDSASNPQNFLNAYHNGTSVLLDKCVAGTYTNLITTTVAFTANAPIEIRRPSGNTFQLWYNGTQRGTNQTVSDAGIINNTRYGLFSTYSGGTFSEFSLGGVVIPFNLPGA